jgi:hypothetical protein
MRSGRGKSLYAFIRTVTNTNVITIEAYHRYHLYTKLYHHISVKVIPYEEEIIGDNQCGFRRNGSTGDYIFCIRQMLEKMEIQ